MKDYEFILRRHDRRLRRFRDAVEEWARKHESWGDTWWKSWEHCRGLERPKSASAMLVTESILPETIMWNEPAWYALCDRYGFSFDYYDHLTIGFWSVDESEQAAVQRRAEMEWLTSLVTPDVATVYGEVFRWFSQNPKMMRHLNWRAFEELVASIFAATGFTTKLGTGRADGGIDLRLMEHEVLGDLITVVQIKNTRRAVGLETVQALAGASDTEGPANGLVVTSSRFLPGAVKWAQAWEQATQRTLTLAGPSEVRTWCEAAWSRTWTPDNVLKDPLPRGTGQYVGKIFVAQYGYGITVNKFCLVLRQTPSAVALRRLPTRVVQGDKQVGEEIPLVTLGFDARDSESSEVIAAVRPNGYSGWHGTDGLFYAPWDGQPAHFNVMD